MHVLNSALLLNLSKEEAQKDWVIASDFDMELLNEAALVFKSQG